jgi:anti-sigma factor RsiW
MNRHLSAETLSAYLDDELSEARSRAIAAHIACCGACRARLAAMSRVVHGLRRLEQPAPPAMLAERVRLQAAQPVPPAATAIGGLLRRLRAEVEARGLDRPYLPALSTPLAMALALLVSVLLVEYQEGWRAQVAGVATRPAPEFRVEEAFGDAPLVLPQTTSEVAGRVFVLTGNTWVQRGLDGGAPEARIHAGSVQGRQLLAQLSDLGVLLADGSRVVLRYNLQTLELSNR